MLYEHIGIADQTNVQGTAKIPAAWWSEHWLYCDEQVAAIELKTTLRMDSLW